MTRQYAEEPIAIVGSACRFPGGSSSPSKLWELLREPRDVLKEFDPERLNLSRFHHHDGEAHGSTNVTNSSYILDEDTRVFDAAFFGINPVEAAGMDPQQRVLLETVYEAIESAGMTLDEVKGSLTSVHVGVMSYDWTQVQYRDPETVPQYTATGTAASILANRVSYIFDLRGPSVTIDTACSSSLVALHQAARGLLDGDSEAAVVTGVNLILDPSPYIAESKLHMLSPASRSRMWDEAADGYARGEGTAALLLKKLSRALADGDHIEGLVRATAVNSDGLSPGITMPVSSSQTSLIRQTYRRAGLDPIKDRPQYFECHGTGTPAGDPVEARAVSDAFVAPHVDGATSVDNPMYVGSIKTVVGHLEGCAGLAGVMKVLLAIKHRTIPPNLLFNELNPAVAPYYGSLLIPTKALPWPKLPPGTPARASVNSFGFGGTNAHAIIESFEPEHWADSDDQDAQETAHPSGALGPLVFSAASGPSLLRITRAHLEHLRAHPELSLSDLSWLLQTRRTTHRVRAHFSGASREAILESMDDWVARHEKAPSGGIGYQPRLVNPKEVPGVLGIFTGQGAQWPAMGRQLMAKSSLFRSTIEECEAVLRALPTGDAPTWSFAEELAKDASSSRLGEAALSQPLCTAVQIGLVDLLAAAGISFDAVVGHSSGEIAAVYASGIITRTGAMQIAYYRGFHARLARGTAGQRGGMMAAGLSMDRATQFCNRREFSGRLHVAASNAPQSVTLSGDQDAVQEAKQVLEADGVFARMLKVDTAYHSHHMQPCAEPYLKSILACDIEIQQPKPGKCIWNSSVRGNTELLKGDNLSSLKGPYWVANMVQTVLFSQAVESSIWHGGPFDLAIEVGPHPALKAPVEQTLKAAYGSATPYAGTLQRAGSDVEALSSAVGTVWAQLGPSAIDFAGYHAAFSSSSSSSSPPKSREAANITTTTTTTATTNPRTRRRRPVLKDLPSYAWDHDKVYWRESASSRRYRTARDGFNALLGRRTPDDNARELRWRNVLRLAELPWLRGHEILGQVLVPGATYVSFAIEACRQLGASVTAGREKDLEVSLLEIENLDIHRPLVVPDTRDGVETLFTARLVDDGPSSSLRLRAGSDILRAQFSYYVCVDPATGTMVHTCTGDLAVHFRKPTSLGGERGHDDLLPPRDPIRQADLVAVDWRRIYAFFEGLGLNHQGPLRAIKECSRSFDYATATAVWLDGSLESSGQGGAMAAVHVHPAMLDVAFQTVLVARAHPSSGQITTALLPSHIDRVRVSPRPIPSLSEADPRVDIESWAGQQTLTALTGDVSVYDAASGRTLVQAEGLQMRMVGEPDAGHDRPVFAKTVWARDFAVMGGLLQEPTRDADDDAELLALSEACDRVALFYAQRLVKEIEASHDDRTAFQPQYQRLLELLDWHLAQVATGSHPVLKRKWLADGPTVLSEMDAAHHGAIQLQMLHAVGGKYASIVRGEVNQLEVMTKDDLLNRFYMEDLECIRINQFLASALREITHKYPRCNILEIGAGTGGTTRTALGNIDDAYASYTFTDVSSAFLASAAEKFADQSHKMVFKTLDIDNDPTTQGFAPYSYDVVIAANVLHATRDLTRTLRRVRSMLRPGGYLLLFETTGMQTLSIPFIFGGLAGWWVSEEADRNMGPIVPPLRWDAILQDSGFSGLDTVAYDTGVEARHTTSLLVSQAVNDAVLRLREPLAELAAAAPGPEDALLLIGGKNLVTAKMLAEIQKLLPRAWRRRIQTADSIDAAVVTHIDPGTDVICLQDEDEPVFATSMTPPRLLSLQGLLMKARNLLWVTSATTARSHPPRATMFHGIARVAAVEMPHLNLQVLGLEPGATPATSARHCVEAFLRLRETAEAMTVAGADQDSDEGTLLWAREIEVEVLATGEARIPRVVLDSALNEVYAASKRVVTKPIDGTNLPIRAVPGQSRMMLQPADDLGTEMETSTIRVQVKYALHIPAGTGDGVYLICGTHVPSPSSPPRSIMALSDTNASVVAVPPEHRLFITNEACTAEMLVSAASRLLVLAVAAMAPRTCGKRVLLYGPEESMASELAVELNKQGSCTSFASAAPHAPESWIKVHAQSSRRVVQRAIPRDVALFVDCTVASTLPSAVPDALRDCLPPGCEDWQLDARLLEEALRPFGTDKAEMAPILEDMYAYAQKTDVRARSSLDCELVEAAALSGAQVSSLAHRRYVTNWQKRESLLIAVPPLDTRGLFRPDRTYLMVGAAGGLGLSICRWILANGAKHMVITSRNPKVDPAFLEDAQRAGASVRVLPMDVGNKASADDVVKLVRATMPPIGGVCNAAMVLSDRLFLDLDVEQLNGTLAPKVDGSEYLDTIFADDATLDFFVMLSSSASVLGNVGQANYHMANLFMTNLAAARRARGLAGSVVHVGHITDVGYVATGGRTEQLEEHFRTLRLMPLSETDVHHAFAQAIRGGRPGSQVGSPDIIMGVEPPNKPVAADVAGQTESKIPWLANPRLGHLVPITTLGGESGQQGQNGARAAGGVLQRVQDADSEEDAVAAVLEAFCAKLESTLQLPQGYAADNASRAAIDLGIDSLVAVEIRTWFLKELGVDVPVVKVLGGDSVLQICATAAAAIMARSTKIPRETESKVKAKSESSASMDASRVVPRPFVSVNASPAPAGATERVVESDHSTSVSETNDDSKGSSSPRQSTLSSGTSPSVAKSNDSPSASEEDEAQVKGQAGGEQGVTAPRPKIVRQERMSRAQARIWFLSKHLHDPAAYNMVFLYRIHGPLSMARLRHALQVTTHHHECLRMCFYPRVGDGHGMQGLLASSSYELEHIPNANEADLQSTMARFKTRVWDLEAGRTMGIAVLSRGGKEHDFVLGYHHIISDVVGTFVFLQDLDRAYRLQPLDKAGAGSHLDYTAQLLEREAAGAYDDSLKFWREEFATLPDPLSLLPQASVHARPAAQQTIEKEKSTHSEYHTLAPSTVAAVKAMCRRLRISPFHFYLAVLQVFLARSTGAEDVCIGIVDANRGVDDDQISRMVGCFVNLLPVRGEVSHTASFAAVVRETSRKALAAFVHSGVPFDMLLEAVQAPRWSDGATAPLTQASINYRAAGWGQLPLGADCRMALRLDDGKDVETPYDVSLGLMDLAEGCTIDLHTRAALYGAHATREMLQAYVRLVTAFAAEPDMRIDQCLLQDEAQVTEARVLGTGPETDFGWPATLSQRVRDMCRLYAARPAIADGAETVNYSQLAARVDGVANALYSLAGTTTGDRVAVLCEPSVDATVAMLSVLQAGCVYVPLDSSLPTVRHAAMIESCKPVLVLYHAATEQSVLELGTETSIPFTQMSVSDVPELTPDTQQQCASNADAPAILLFTSGSTGTPKGILLTQGNFANHIALKTQVLGLGLEDNVLQQSSLGFDMSLVQTFCALANGGCLVVVPSDARRDPVALTSLLRGHAVSLTIATPSEYLAWLHYGGGSLRDHSAWRHACMGGELVSTELKMEFARLELMRLRLTNCYGPTEITAAATFQTIGLDDYADGGGGDANDGDEQHQIAKYAVGKALPNYSVCILDFEGRPQPVQHTGEICIGGAGVALGYLDLADETRAKFITDPEDPGRRLYRTGDKGRLLPDGTLLCFGRVEEGDTQIKLRGLRVEIQEVETALLRAAGGRLSTVVVSRRGDILVAHATMSPGGRTATLSGDEVAGILGRLRLPQYFVPATIVVLPALPTNANGKLDRKAIATLPLPTDGNLTQKDNINSQDVPPEKMNIREGELRLLWERVLPPATATMGRIAPSSDFFLRGGNSLLLMRLQSAIRESMGVAVSTRALYRASTLASMAEIVKEAREAAAQAIGDLEDIDWTAEAAMPAALKQQVLDMLQESTTTATPAQRTCDGIDIVLTGATGFLGGRILHMLLQSPAVRKVHCIAVLSGYAHLLPEEDRIRSYTGSLADPTLGLSPTEHALLSQTSDVIIHAGSDGHCLNNYATLRAANVASTQSLAALALPRAVPLLFVSSYRVALLGGRTAQPAASMATNPPPGDGREGLTASKWVAEAFLENLAAYYHQQQQQQREWKVAVHRPCIVVGEQAPNSDSMNAILRFSLSMHCVPLLKRGKGYIDFAPAEGVASGVAQAALRMAGLEGDDDASTVAGQVQFTHHSSNTRVPVDGFGAHLEKVYGGRFEELPMREWLDRASTAGIDPLITAYLDGVTDTDEEMVFPYLGED